MRHAPCLVHLSIFPPSIIFQIPFSKSSKMKGLKFFARVLSPSAGFGFTQKSLGVLLGAATCFWISSPPRFPFPLGERRSEIGGHMSPLNIHKSFRVITHYYPGSFGIFCNRLCNVFFCIFGGRGQGFWIFGGILHYHYPGARCQISTKHEPDYSNCHEWQKFWNIYGFFKWFLSANL